MNRKSVGIVVLGIALVPCFAAITIAAVDRIPVKGAFTGQIHRTKTSETPPTWSVKATGTVRFAGIGVGTAEVVYDKVGLAPGGDNLDPGSLEGTGVITLTTGDKLFGTFRWLTAPAAEPNVLAIVGTMTVTDGTGRFEGSRGSGIAIGRGNVPANEIAFSVEGFLEGISNQGRRPGFGG